MFVASTEISDNALSRGSSMYSYIGGQLLRSSSNYHMIRNPPEMEDKISHSPVTCTEVSAEQEVGGIPRGSAANAEDSSDTASRRS